jgi:hypothetical protein
MLGQLRDNVNRVRLDGQSSVNPGEERFLLGEDNNSPSILSSASGTANTVDVLFGAGRKAHLDDKTDVGEVHTTSHDVRGDKDSACGIFEGLCGLCTSGLGHAAVQFKQPELRQSNLVQIVKQSDSVGRCAEHNGLEILGVLGVLLLDQRQESGKGPSNRGNGDRELRHSLVRRCLVGVHSRECGEGRVQHALGDIHDFPACCCAVAAALPSRVVVLRGEASQDLLDSWRKASVKHLVGLVEDKSLQVGKLPAHLLFSQDIVESSRRCNKNGRVSSHECIQVGSSRSTSESSVAFHPARQAGSNSLCFLGNLQCQLARRADDEDADLAPRRRIASEDVLDGGKQESDRLASTGLGLHHAIGGERREFSKHLLLDGRHVPGRVSFVGGERQWYTYSKPICSSPCSSDLSSLPAISENRLASALPAAVLYMAFTSTGPPSFCGAAFCGAAFCGAAFCGAAFCGAAFCCAALLTLGRLGCCAAVDCWAAAALGAPPLGRGRFHLRLGGGGMTVLRCL